MVRRALSCWLRAAKPQYRQYSAAVLPTSDSPHERRARSLLRHLQAGSHARVWDSYTDIISAAGVAALPLELHQQVLRQCSPPKDVHRESMRNRISSGTFSDPFHVHEGRYKAVIQNITSSGQKPTVDDYDFILDQLAAVGYYQGVLSVYKHMLAQGYTPTPHSFTACFRAIAFRFSLPVPPNLRDDLVTYTTALFRQLMADHSRFKLELSPANMELILRILKETLDRPSFEFLLRTAYGIDLANPDRLALEYATPGSPPRVPLPFNTAVLNTTLDMLGRMGDVSRLVSAFEVLTQPLPQAAQHFFNAFEEDDDDLGSSSAAAPAPLPLPSAVPNTTTYNILLRYLARHAHPALARHYLIQAVRLDRATAWDLRHLVDARRRRPALFADVPAPRFALARLALLPVFGAANRHQDLALLQWLASKIPYILRKQRADLAFFERVLAELRAEGRLPQPNAAADADADHIAAVRAARAADAPKPFDLALHVRVLRANTAEITKFSQRLDFVLERTAQRIKERLGRRVWAAKDVYLRSADERVHVSKDTWRAIVNFRPMKPEHLAMPRARSRGPFTSNPKPELPLHARKMSTFASLKSMPHPILRPPQS